MPKGPQTGSIVLQRKGFQVVEGAWVPSWQFDALCLERSDADDAAARFQLDLLKAEWHGAPPGQATQGVKPSVGDAWFDLDELRARATEQHGTAGAECSDCGTWRWMPLAFGALPPLRIVPALDGVDVAASPQWFGDGWSAYRQILIRRELAELVAAASPRDFKVQSLV